MSERVDLSFPQLSSLTVLSGWVNLVEKSTWDAGELLSRKQSAVDASHTTGAQSLLEELPPLDLATIKGFLRVPSVYRYEKEHEDCCATICESAETINSIGVSEIQEKHLNTFDLYLTGRKNAPEERKQFKTARQYLWLVSRELGWPFALLILCALGRWRLQNLFDEQRAKILKYVAHNSSSLRCPRLKEKAIQCNLQQIRISQSLNVLMSAQLSQMSN